MAEQSLLLKLWPQIVIERGFSDAQQGEDGRRQFLNDLAARDYFLVKGTKASMGRWFFEGEFVL